MVSPTAVTGDLFTRLNVASGPGLEAEKFDGARMLVVAEKPHAGKMVLAMGYRADCDKCRARVPGHYNHIIQT